MARWYGVVGFTKSVKTAPGVMQEQIVEHPYSGNVIRQSSRYYDSESVVGDINVSNSISIVADQFAYENFMHIRYVEWMGCRWKVSNVEVEHPRLILTVGGLYEVES